MLDADTGGWLVANRTSDNGAVLRLQSKHRARLAEIRAFNKPPPSKQLAHRWSESPYGSKPHYSHVSRNAKRAQVEGERHQAIERDNLLLLQKMTTLLSSGASSRRSRAASSSSARGGGCRARSPGGARPPPARASRCARRASSAASSRTGSRSTGARAASTAAAC